MNYNNADRGAQTNASADDLHKAAELLLQMEKLREAERSRNASGTQAVRREARTINPLELLVYLISKLHFVLIGMLVGSIAMGMYATNISVPIYTATAKMYIMGQTDKNIVSLADLQRGMALTMDYQEVFRTWEVHEMVNEELGTNYPYGYLQSILTVQNPEDTRILYIIVRNTDAQRAADIANAYISAGKRFIVQTMNTDEPNAFSMALVPSVASSISVTGYTISGFLAGALLSVGILVLVFLMDSRPKSTDDILQYAGIPTLAVIPANVYLSGKGRKSKKIRESNS